MQQQQRQLRRQHQSQRKRKGPRPFSSWNEGRSFVEVLPKIRGNAKPKDAKVGVKFIRFIQRTQPRGILLNLGRMLTKAIRSVHSEHSRHE